MPLTDKVAAAKQIEQYVKHLVHDGGFRLKYRITVNPPLAEGKINWEQPDILVEFAGPDSGMLVERGGELLRSFEGLALKILKLEHNEHDRLSFDAKGFKAGRLEELKMAAQVAAERVRSSGTPYTFASMNSRERRILHLALSNESDLRTESTGEGFDRSVVLYPKDYRGRAPEPRRPMRGRGRR
jgi:spoIIIJ-associated protein